jgi:hypothetical protein
VILLCGIPSESPLRLVASELDRLGAKFRWFNQRRFDTAEIAFEIDADGVRGSLHTDDGHVSLGDVTGVYLRLMDDSLLPELASEPHESPRRERCRALHDALIRWAEVAPCHVVNRYTAQASNGSKPYQLQLIAARGFAVPETLVTNDPEAVRAFRARHGRVIYKSVSGQRSIVRSLSRDDEERLDQIRWCPVQFQQHIDGANMRVHVIADEVFATTIASDAVDYRYGDDAKLSPAVISPDLATRCIGITQDLGLAFAGIDLLVGPDGDAWCLEVNPSPAFSYYETQTGQAIAAAVARHLASAGTAVPRARLS